MAEPPFFAPERHDAGDFVLRPWRPGDGRMVADAVRESYEHLRTFMAWATPDPNAEESEADARRFAAMYLTSEDFLIGIFDPSGTRVLGGTGFHLRGFPLKRRSAEIGMWIRASEAGRGLGTRALGAMLAWGFTEWPWLRLAWHASGANLASQRVAEKGGLRKEGVLVGDDFDPDGSRRDTVIFALTKGEWDARS